MRTHLGPMKFTFNVAPVEPRQPCDPPTNVKPTCHSPAHMSKGACSGADALALAAKPPAGNPTARGVLTAGSHRPWHDTFAALSDPVRSVPSLASGDTSVAWQQSAPPNRGHSMTRSSRRRSLRLLQARWCGPATAAAPLWPSERCSRATCIHVRSTTFVLIDEVATPRDGLPAIPAKTPRGQRKRQANASHK